MDTKLKQGHVLEKSELEMNDSLNTANFNLDLN